MPRGPNAAGVTHPGFRRGAMVSIYETAKRELGYNATRFGPMISEQGRLTTAK
jgi:hypothetical protein